MILLQPLWLILLVPAAVVFYLWKMPTRTLAAIRIIITLLVIFIIADPAIKLDDRKGTVIVLADRSASMPDGSTDRAVEAVNIIQQEMPAGNSLGVVAFGEQAIIDKSTQFSNFDQFIAQVNPNGSNLYDGISKAVSMIDQDIPGRIIVLSDGRWTGSVPYSAAASLASRDIAIDYRHMARLFGKDLAIARIAAPQIVMPGQAYMINSWIQAPEPVEIRYELVRENRIIGRGTRKLKAGINNLAFRDIAGKFGTYTYTLKIDGYEDETIRQNNIARFITRIDANKPVLALTQTENSGLVKLLQKDGINVVRNHPSDLNYSLDKLSGYSAILLEDVNANDIGHIGMENIAAWVTETGSGLIMTGGPNSYGPGGYFRSPIEPIMPVTMELRREHRKLNMAIVLVLDRSGSMAAPASNGQTKMDLANAASAEVLGLLSANDELGVIAVDSLAHTIAKCGPIGDDPSSLRKKILSIESMGGGIFVYEGLVNAAAMLSNAKAETRHIILFADAADSEEPGDYKNLLAKCRSAGITTSVIGLGSEKDSDAELLKDIALRGEGRCFFTQNALELPRLFAQDTFMIARNSFINEPVEFNFTVGLNTIMDMPAGSTKSVGGYNLCYTRPEANLAAVTLDGYDAPILAAWQVGAGRAAAFCAQADGDYSGQLAQWPDVGKLYSSVVRWAIGQADGLGNDIAVTQQVANGICQVQIHIDSEANRLPFSKMPTVNVLIEQTGKAPLKQKIPVEFASADKLIVDIPLNGDSVVLATVDAGTLGKVTLPPVCAPYSPEFKPDDADTGLQSLQRLSRITGGRSLTDLTGIWETIPKKNSYVDLTPWLATLAVILFLLEILERRTGILSMTALRRKRSQIAAEDQQQQTEPGTTTSPQTSSIAAILGKISSKMPRIKKQTSTSNPAAQQPNDTKTTTPQTSEKTGKTTQKPEPQKSGDLLDALNKVKKR